MHLFIVELGHIGELFLDVFGKALSLEIVERVGPHDPEVDALKKQNIGDALHRATTDNGKHAQVVSVIEHGSQVRAELNIGAADGAGYQRHRVGIQGLFGGRRAELEYRLEAFADLAGSDLVRSARAVKPNAIIMANIAMPSSRRIGVPALVKTNSAFEQVAALHPANRAARPSGTRYAPPPDRE